MSNPCVGLRARASAVFIPFILLFTSLPALAQSSGLIRGTVTDPQGAVVTGATVTIQGLTGSYKRTATTDEQGQYQFYNVPFADYTLQVSATGFSDATDRVEVHTGSPIEKAFQLSLEGTSEEITVTDTATADHMVGTEYTVPTATIEKLPTLAPSRQIEGVLLQLPGIVADENGRFHPRGAHYQASFVVDGVQVTDQMSTVFANNFDAQNIEGVNLISGFVPPEYGNKVAAVINVASKSGLGSNRQFFGDLSVGAGSFSQFDTSAQFGGQLGQSFGYFFSASHTQSRRYLDAPFQNATAFGLVAGDEGFHNNGDGQRYFTRLDWTASDKDIFKVTVFGGRSLFDVPNLPSQQLAGQDQQQFIRDIAVYPSWLHVFNANWSTNVAPYYRTSNAELLSSPFDTPVTASQQRHLTTAGINASASYTGNGHTAKFGIDFAAVPISENFTFAITNPEFNAPDAPEYDANLTPYDLTRGGGYFRFSDTTTGHQYAFYAQDSYTWNRLTLSGGIRYDNYRLLQKADAWSPRVGLAYVLPTRTALRFSYNRVFQTPSNENLLLSSSQAAVALIPADRLAELGGVGARVVPPERSHWYEAGIAQPIGDLFSIDAAYYWKNVSFLHDNDQFLNTGIVFPIALASGHVQGFELRVDVPTHYGFSGNFSFSHTKALAVPPFAGGLFLSEEAVAGLENAGEPFRIDHDEPLASAFLVAWDGGPRLGLFATLEGRYDSGLVTEIEDVDAVRSDPDLAPGLALVDFSQDPLRVKSRFLLNASVGKELFKREHYTVRASFSALNLTNENRLYNYLSVFSGTHYIPPRSFGGRLEFSF